MTRFFGAPAVALSAVFLSLTFAAGLSSPALADDEIGDDAVVTAALAAKAADSPGLAVETQLAGEFAPRVRQKHSRVRPTPVSPHEIRRPVAPAAVYRMTQRVEQPRAYFPVVLFLGVAF